MELHGEQLAEDPGAEEGVQQRVVGHHGEAGQAAHQVTWGDTSVTIWQHESQYGVISPTARLISRGVQWL